MKGNLLPFATFFVLYGKIAGALPIFDRYNSTVFYSGSNYKVEAMTCSAEQQHSSCLNQNTYHKNHILLITYMKVAFETISVKIISATHNDGLALNRIRQWFFALIKFKSKVSRLILYYLVPFPINSTNSNATITENWEMQLEMRRRQFDELLGNQSFCVA